MKPTIYTGAYGWRHALWEKSFYPHDLPVDEDDDWRLTYYSNEFNVVMAPASYWLDGILSNCDQWLDEVPADFRFYVECEISMFDTISLEEFKESLEKLQPQLSALIFLDTSPLITPALKNQLTLLFNQLKLEVYGAGFMSRSKPVWCENNHNSSNFAYYENDLSDLRAARVMVENFTSGLEANIDNATIIVDHPRLTAENLTRFRSLLQIMGF